MSEQSKSESKELKSSKIYFRTYILIGLIILILGIFVYNRISLFFATPPEHGIDYSIYPWYLIPVYYIYNYLKSAWISLLFAFIVGGIIREYLPQNIINKYLKSNRFSNYIIAAALAPVFITCSCSVVPIYVGLLVAGASLGVVMTFFLMAPAANFITIVLTGEYLGWDLGLFRLLFSFLGAVMCGYLFDRSKFGKDIEEKYRNMQVGSIKKDLAEKTLNDRIFNVWKNFYELVKDIFPLLLVGLVIVAYIAAYLPSEWITNYFTGFSGIIFGAILGGPVYTPALVEIVLTRGLMEKGMARSTALAFMMGQPYDFVAVAPNAKYFKWQGVVLYFIVFFIFSIIAGVIYALIFHIPL